MLPRDLILCGFNIIMLSILPFAIKEFMGVEGTLFPSNCVIPYTHESRKKY